MTYPKWHLRAVFVRLLASKQFLSPSSSPPPTTIFHHNQRSKITTKQLPTHMAEPNSLDSLCAMCDKQGIHACSGCHSIRYCSKLCQKTDWTLQKLLCKTYADFSDAFRPPKIIKLYKRAIYFPELGERPRFIWVRYHGPDAAGRVIVDMHYVNPDFEDLRPVNELSKNMVLHRQLGRCISIAGRG
jgi:hypothetical protein